MTICILAPRFPFPENGGDVLRINSIARYLKSKKHTIILISFYSRKDAIVNDFIELYDDIHLVKFSRCFSIIFSFLFFIIRKPIQCGYYFSPSFSRKLKEVKKKYQPDLYISHLLRTAPYLEKEEFRNKAIIEMTDALSKTYILTQQSKRLSVKKVIYKLEKKLIANYEKFVIQKFRKVCLVSETDIKYLCNQNDTEWKNIFCYTNGVNYPTVLSENFDDDKICFIGNMRTLQNQDAVFFFVEEVLPKLRKEIPNVVFEIIGAEPPESIKKLDDGKTILVSGYVVDIEKEISSCCVTVAPVRIAAGIQNKVLISMACGVPVVLTSLISKAIPGLESEINCVIADTSDAIANSLIEIMKNKVKREYLSQNGLKMIEENYSWNKCLEGYEII